MLTVKTFVRANNTTTIICPTCKMAKNVNVAPYKNKKHLLKVRCPCGEQFAVQLDFRAYYRKKTDLFGTLHVSGDNYNESHKIQIKNLSFSGVGFIMELSKYIKEGQRITVEFMLDDKRKNMLRKEVVVKLIMGNYIGGQFADIDPFEKDLGFFLKN